MSSTTVREILDERVTAFEATMSVEEAIDAIRTSTSGSEHTVYYAYVIDDDRTLQRVASMRELLNADGETPVSEVGTEDVVAVESSDTVDHAAELLVEHGFTALPVVDDAGELLGLVRSGDVIESLDEEAPKEDLRKAIRDVEYDPSEASAYECFTCGTVVTSVDNPVECPNCGGDVRHRQTPIE